uniref:Uncharacterized protein n=1 Tax=Aegilops tauschii subsp. strangulata TaxID=200361 RepID=A0A453G363_AEGTS
FHGGTGGARGDGRTGTALRAAGDLALAAWVSREEVFVITQCASLGGKLPFDDVSVGAVLSVITKVESFGDQLAAEISQC